MLQWIREKLSRRSEPEEFVLFPEPRCPCCRPQPDTDRLYCDPCIERMAREIASDEARRSP